MSLMSDSRKWAQNWFDLAERLPSVQRRAALEIAEAWFELAMDASALEINDGVVASNERTQILVQQTTH
jgi:hypothetical protein